MIDIEFFTFLLVTIGGILKKPTSKIPAGDVTVVGIVVVTVEVSIVVVGIEVVTVEVSIVVVGIVVVTVEVSIVVVGIEVVTVEVFTLVVGIVVVTVEVSMVIIGIEVEDKFVYIKCLCTLSRRSRTGRGMSTYVTSKSSPVVA